MVADSATGSGGDRVAIIGAGIGGLAAALRLAHAGARVTLLERHAAPGGRMRAVPSAAGPVDAGPTVLTLRDVFDDLFAAVGERLADHLTLIRQPLIARHFWADGSRLDLFDDPDRNAEAIGAFAGARAARQFRRFQTRSAALYRAFEAPMMRDPDPSPARIAALVAARPGLLAQMAPGRSLAGQLARSFDDRRLAQLFGRYATYVGGLPQRTPALLSLIWRAESAGVWAVQGGMHRLAQVLAGLAQARGATLRMGAHVARIETVQGRVCAVVLDDGGRIAVDRVIFNGDARALAAGVLGPDMRAAAPQLLRLPPALSAEVWAFAARPSGPDLAHHNLFFRDDPEPEFRALASGRRIDDPTLYVCAMDRGMGTPVPDPERFEIIANAPPLPPGTAPTTETAGKDHASCLTRGVSTLARFGLRFNPTPGADSLTTPAGFARLFPGSAGSLYGQSPQGMLSAFRRPRVRCPVRGLYLAGGSVHPGPGVPMAALSGLHAAEAILADRISTSPCQRTVMPGGISTGSAPMADAPSASSPS